MAKNPGISRTVCSQPISAPSKPAISMTKLFRSADHVAKAIGMAKAISARSATGRRQRGSRSASARVTVLRVSPSAIFRALRPFPALGESACVRRNFWKRSGAGSPWRKGNLTVQISALRKVLGPKAIATVPGVGYKLAVGASTETLPHRALPCPTNPRSCRAALRQPDRTCGTRLFCGRACQRTDCGLVAGPGAVCYRGRLDLCATGPIGRPDRRRTPIGCAISARRRNPASRGSIADHRPCDRGRNGAHDLDRPVHGRHAGCLRPPGSPDRGCRLCSRAQRAHGRIRPCRKKDQQPRRIRSVPAGGAPRLSHDEDRGLRKGTRAGRTGRSAGPGLYRRQGALVSALLLGVRGAVHQFRRGAGLCTDVRRRPRYPRRRSAFRHDRRSCSCLFGRPTTARRGRVTTHGSVASELQHPADLGGVDADLREPASCQRPNFWNRSGAGWRWKRAT
jgi:hypothetical protein